MNIWRVDLARQSLAVEDTPPTWQGLGGRGLIARILLDEVDPGCDPLGPENILIFTPGLLVGYRLSSCDRISVGTKSPLTGGVKEANAGGKTGAYLARLGIKALILEGQGPGNAPQVLHISRSGVEFLPAGELAGKGVYQSAELLTRRFGTGPAQALIGPGGELKLTGAGIFNLDKDGVPSRANARGGVGAVMGAKGIKALVIEDTGGENPPIADQGRFRAAQKAYNKALLDHPQTRIYADYGTAAMTMMSNGFGGLPTRNFSSGEFEGADAISGEHLRDTLLERGGKSDPTHACMTGCAIRCSNVVSTPDGGEVAVSPLEYETIGLMGSNLGLADLDEIARLNWEANDLGLDSIELGAALGVAAEAGLFRFGDAAGAMRLLDEIRAGSEIGRALGDGAAAVGRKLGVSRVPVVKGQAMSAYEPRAIKGTGVTYATTPQGADHTCGLTIRAKVDHLDPSGQVELSLKSQISMAGYDTLGACLFAGFGFAAAPGTIPELLGAISGEDFGPDPLQELGRETLRLELAFNRGAGFTAADDRLPDWMTSEPLPPHQAVFDVPAEELEHIFDDL